MLAKRLLVTIILLPIGVAVIQLGGLAYAITIAIILGLAGWEFGRLFKTSGEKPVTGLIIAAGALLPLSQAFLNFEISIGIFVLLVLAAMVIGLVRYESGDNRAATGFAITASGLVYIGWIGSYLVSLRQVTDGSWWVLTILPTVWMADAGAMFIGMRFGKHMLAPRLSPKKTWEGYIGGILSGVFGGILFAALWGLVVPEITIWKGALIGLILSVLAPLGDLGESMIKRQVGAKDSSNILPGHGGVFDRIDSWLWAAVIGYYFVNVFG
jgi:phosphatidate cytidylyltransferase